MLLTKGEMAARSAASRFTSLSEENILNEE